MTLTTSTITGLQSKFYRELCWIPEIEIIYSCMCIEICFFNIIWPAMSAHWHEGLNRKLFYFTTVCLNVWTSLIHLFAWLHFHILFSSTCQLSERSLSDWPTWMQSNHMGKKIKNKKLKNKDLSIMQLWFKFACIQIFPLVKLFTVPCARQKSAVKSR